MQALCWVPYIHCFIESCWPYEVQVPLLLLLPILQMVKWRHRKGVPTCPSSITSEWQSWDLNADWACNHFYMSVHDTGLISVACFFKKFVYLFLFLAALGLRCCTWAFSSYGEQGLLFVVVHRLLIAVASLVAEHGL